MLRTFPSRFVIGTSTAAAQIETAFQHDWQGVKARDGKRFERTTDHELRLKEDAVLIAGLAPAYRMGLSWSRLQLKPFAPFQQDVVLQYRDFLQDLRARNVSIMMVLHHFTNPTWFTMAGSWEKKSNIEMWLDFGRKVIEHFGEYVSEWNTFNEPNIYASYGWLTGDFPPFRMNPLKAMTVVKNLGFAHEQMYKIIKAAHPSHPVGISHNCVVLSGHNMLGKVAAAFSDWWFMDFVLNHFESFDFFGMSYYTRILHDPMPVTYLDTAHKIKRYGLEHDDLWEYHPEGMRACIDRYWKKYKKPIIITENGVCDKSDKLRQRAIIEYTTIVHKAIEDGIDIRGYYWWTAWDNFEWHLGPSYSFGLYEMDWETKNRIARPSAALFSKLAHSNTIPEAVV